MFLLCRCIHFLHLTIFSRQPIIHISSISATFPDPTPPLPTVSIRWEDAPEQQNPVQGTDAKIKCKVRANPVAVVEWLKGEQTISSGGRWVTGDGG